MRVFLSSILLPFFTQESQSHCKSVQSSSTFFLDVQTSTMWLCHIFNHSPMYKHAGCFQYLCVPTVLQWIIFWSIQIQTKELDNLRPYVRWAHPHRSPSLLTHLLSDSTWSMPLGCKRAASLLGHWVTLFSAVITHLPFQGRCFYFRLLLSESTFMTLFSSLSWYLLIPVSNLFITAGDFRNDKNLSWNRL